MGGALLQPSNPDNMAAGGATDAQCGEGEGGGGERGGGDIQQITAYSNPYSSFSLSFYPLCIRRGFDKNFARSCAEQELSRRLTVFTSKKLEKESLSMESLFESIFFNGNFTVSFHA